MHATICSPVSIREYVLSFAFTAGIREEIYEIEQSKYCMDNNVIKVSITSCSVIAVYIQYTSVQSTQ